MKAATTSSNVRLLDAQTTGLTLRRLITQHDELYWAVAWASTRSVPADALFKNRHKIARLVVGTQFNQTDPEFLSAFKETDNVLVVPQDNLSTFHPKVYLFSSGDRFEALVGSANFTGRGVSTNTEAVLHMQGHRHDPVMVDLLAFVTNTKGQLIDDDFLAAYRRAHNAAKVVLARVKKPVRIVRARKRGPNSDLLDLDWDEYQARLEARHRKTLDARLRWLSKARQFFAETQSFADLEPVKRAALAGVPIHHSETARMRAVGLRGIDWGWFGSMKGSGFFMAEVKRNNQALADAIDSIPLSGAVAEDEYRNYVRALMRAFRRSPKKPRVATATRLLAMKRPDIFVCLDSRNFTGLRTDMRFATSLTSDLYWDEVVLPLQESRWWLSDRPSDAIGRQLWDARVALLDHLYDEGG